MDLKTMPTTMQLVRFQLRLKNVDRRIFCIYQLFILSAPPQNIISTLVVIIECTRLCFAAGHQFSVSVYTSFLCVSSLHLQHHPCRVCFCVLFLLFFFNCCRRFDLDRSVLLLFCFLSFNFLFSIFVFFYVNFHFDLFHYSSNSGMEANDGSLVPHAHTLLQQPTAST